MAAFTGRRQIFINNAWVDAKSGKTFDVIDPSTGAVITKVAEGDAADIDAAVEAAAAAFKTWRKVPGEGRAALLNKLADLIMEHKDTLAHLESLNNGTNITAAVNLMHLSAMWLRHYAGYADKLKGTTSSLVDPSLFTYTVYVPMGVVGAIVPWNFPVVLTCWKLGPALACGNTVVIKPSEKTPLTALYLAELAQKAGFPPGVSTGRPTVNVVPGYGPTAGSALARHMKVAKVTFTGSVTTGRAILRDAANSNLKRVTLELGGKSPLIVCPDVDLAEAAERAHAALFYNNGQVCSAGSRVFVHESIYDAFVEKVVARAKKRLARVGPATDPKTELQPIVDGLQFERVKGYIQAGLQDGATLAFGGKVIPRSGYYLEPTIFTNVTDGMRIAREEIFGPVMSIIKYKTYEEALERANNTEFGLGAGVLSRNISTALTLAHNIDSGTVWINTYGAVFPQTAFGGFKQSGLGRENGETVLYEYMQLKTITVGGLGLPKL